MKQIQNYTIIKQLGEGAFGTTYLAERDGKQVVIKQMKLDQTDHWKALERFHREAEVLKQLNHPGIPKYIDFIETETFAGIVQEYIEGGILEEFIENRKGKIPHQQLKDLMKQGLEILIYLQSFTNPIVHRDISPKNFLLDRNNKLYLIDFGGVQQSCAYNSDTVTCMGTFGYMAPEQLMGNATPQSDLYSFGMVMISLITGKPVENMAVDKKTGKLKLKKILKEQSDSMIKMISGLVEPGVGKRFQSATEAAYHLEHFENRNNFAEYIEIVPEDKKRLTIYWMERQPFKIHEKTENDDDQGKYQQNIPNKALKQLVDNKDFPVSIDYDNNKPVQTALLALALGILVDLLEYQTFYLTLIFIFIGVIIIATNIRLGLNEQFIQNTLHFSPEGIKLHSGDQTTRFEWKEFVEIHIPKRDQLSKYTDLNFYTLKSGFPNITKITRLKFDDAKILKDEIDHYIKRCR